MDVEGMYPAVERQVAGKIARKKFMKTPMKIVDHDHGFQYI